MQDVSLGKNNRLAYGRRSLYAVSGVVIPSASDILQNLTQELPMLMRLVTAFAYVMGIYMIFYGILKLKQYGEQRSMMSQEKHLQGTIVMLVVGALLLYLPTSVQIGMSTFWSNPSPYGYLSEASDQWGTVIKDVFLVMQLFGTIVFIKGLIILSHLTGQGHQQGMLAKGITHIVGGL